MDDLAVSDDSSDSDSAPSSQNSSSSSSSSSSGASSSSSASGAPSPPSSSVSPAVGSASGTAPPASPHVVRPMDASGEPLPWNRTNDPLGIGFAAELLYRPPERGPGSPNVSYCVLCWDGGDLVLCDYCERAFHRDCYVGEVEDDAEGQWRCLLCSEPPRLAGPDRPRPERLLASADLLMARRLLLELYAAYYPCLYFRSRSNLELLPEWRKLKDPICLDDIKERLSHGKYTSLMDLLKALKRLMDMIRSLKKGSVGRKYLKELEEVFDSFVRDHMHEFWLQLDESSSR
ncbi:nuclear body protein SP140-like protein [Pollicipes pollicipes]|uniref:nuclear body protein SP140-like protein n=1 Tax=Pollicipes pollicipes TaxID=41117 RepID=UPI0018856DF3|nr:nuclear body protein SP140-like protein [Pollicipes pollicipes]